MFCKEVKGTSQLTMFYKEVKETTFTCSKQVSSSNTSYSKNNISIAHSFLHNS